MVGVFLRRLAQSILVVLIVALIVTGVDAFDASSIREASAPRNPSAVEYRA